MLTGYGKQIKQPLPHALDPRGEIGEIGGKLLQPAILESLVVQDDRTAVAQDHQQRFGEQPARVPAAGVEEFLVLEQAGLALDVAGPLEWHLLVRPRSRPDRHREVDGLEVEVVAQIAELVQCDGRGRPALGFTFPFSSPS